jgi:hypothetical protein
MKVIIELNEYMKIENGSDENTINIIIDHPEISGCSTSVNIDDLKLALRKMTAK